MEAMREQNSLRWNEFYRYNYFCQILIFRALRADFRLGGVFYKVIKTFEFAICIWKKFQQKYAHTMPYIMTIIILS